MTITIDDRGHKGAGGPLTTRKEILLSIEPQNDSPRLVDTPTNLTAQEDSILELPMMHFEDDDLLSPEVSPLFELYILVQHGEILCTDEQAMSNTEIQLEERNEIRVVGIAEDLNRILGSMTYQGDSNFNTEDELREETLTIQVRDVTDNFGQTLASTDVLQDQVVIPLSLTSIVP